MAGLLGDIYSTIDSTKRKLSDFVQNPVESTRQFIFNRNEDAGKQLGLLDQSFRGANGQLTIGPQTPQAQAAHNQLTDGLLSAMMGATVWHGSPHKFNKFDSSKIGTGEGAQAYGHGLYLAESKDVADIYRKTLTQSDDFVDGQLLDSTNPRHFLARVLNDESGNLTAAKDSLEMFARPGGSKSVAESAKQALRLLESGERPALQTIKPDGSLYKVDLPDEHIAKMLDWDKPLSQQSPEVQSVLQKALQKNPNMTGEDLYRKFSIGDTSRPHGANTLKDMGIPGIRYLDGGSRGTGTGTSNYVVFPGNEDILKILERNGKGLLD